MLRQQKLYSLYIIGMLFLSINTIAQSNFNVTRTFVAQKPITNVSDIISSTRSVTEVTQATEYLDGFGRPVQSVVKKGSPSQKDLVEFHVYNNSVGGREEQKYLPFVSTGNDGNYKTDALQQQTVFCQNQYPGETNFYGQINYENSPLNRTLNTYAPGNSWVGSSRGTGVQYLVNTNTDNVQMWNIALAQGSIPTSAGMYATGQLYKTITKDEKNTQVIEFKDKEGHSILKKVQLSASLDDGSGSAHSGWLCTYYVYDDYGNQRFIITPKVVQQIDGSWSISQNIADELCYRYEYDLWNRTIIKKDPGIGEQWFVYDQRSRLVMSQDANLRAQQQWKYYQYDVLDRPVSVGLITDPSNYNNQSYHQNNAATSIAYPNVSSYTAEILSQTFYDNYAWVNNYGAGLNNSIDLSNTSNTAYFLSADNNNFPYPQAIVQTAMMRGLTTGSKTEILGSNGSQYIYTVSFYDDKGRVIQSQGTNISNGIDKATTQYSWSGKVLRILEQNNNNNINQSHTILTTINYDAGWRAQSTYKSIASTLNGTSINSGNKLIASYTYNELGQLSNKSLGSNPTTSAPLETLAYDYNIRGWLTGINKNFTMAGVTSNYFGMELGYDKTSTANGSTTFSNASYDGNISGQVWKTKGDGVPRKYDYTYDNANQLTSAIYVQNTAAGGNTWDNGYMNFSVDNISYDANGNIGNLYQYGFSLGGSQPIDNLEYHYRNNENSNILLCVRDFANNPSSKLGDFHYPSSLNKQPVTFPVIPPVPQLYPNDYTYDNNGNLTSDINKSIGSITYNVLNLPSVISTAKGTITYIYDAAGIKLKKITQENNASISYNGNMYTSNITSTTTYIGGFVYQSKSYTDATLNGVKGFTEKLLLVNHEEGRARIVTQSTGTQVFAFDYFIKDHLGNVRVTLTDENDPNPFSYLATLNPSVATDEEKLFDNLPATRTQITQSMVDVSHASGTYAAKTNYNGSGSNNTGYKTGPAIVLKVMVGDQLLIATDAYCQSSTGNNNNVTNLIASDILNSMALGIAGTGVTSETGAALASSAPLNSSALQFFNDKGASNPNYPKAYLNYIFLDEQLKYVSSSATQIDGSAINAWQTLTPNGNPYVTVPKNGYIYVFVSNESNYDVYFYNLQVKHTPGPLVEEKHYYPTGLAMYGLNSRSFGKLINAYGYQGKELQNTEFTDGTGLEEYDFEARYYDPQLGRWHNPDPAGQFASPYLAMGNNWPNGTDPDGRIFGIDDVIISAAIIGAMTGTASYLVGNFLNGGSWNDLTLKGFAMSAGMGAFSGAFTAGVGIAFKGVGSIGHELLRAGVHGIVQGEFSMMQGGNFGSGFLSGAFSSYTGSETDRIHNPWLQLGASFGTGGIGGVIGGGNFLEGAIAGAMVEGLNHLQQHEEEMKFFSKLRDHYEEVTGTPYELTSKEFTYLIKQGIKNNAINFKDAKLQSDGTYVTTINFYKTNSDLKLAFGTSTVGYYLDNNGKPHFNYFHDTYDFDSKQYFGNPHSRSWWAETLTRTYGQISNGKPFEIIYDNRH